MSDSPLRTKQQRMEFCDAFFGAVDAPIVYRADDYREYKLPRDIDKELTDRPYYWLWVEQTGQDVEPTTLRLAFSQDALKRENERLHEEAWARVNPNEMTEVDKMFFRPPTAELVTLGGFRLEKIIDCIRTRGTFICAKPSGHRSGHPLVPWLILNIVVSYTCDMTEQELWSLGICLFNGQVVEGFWEAISPIPMVAVSDNEILGDDESMLTPARALDRLQQFVEQKLKAKPHNWALEARERLTDDLNQLDLYYESLANADDVNQTTIIQTEHQRKRHELITRAEPRIEIEVSQLGLIGLIESA